MSQSDDGSEEDDESFESTGDSEKETEMPPANLADPTTVEIACRLQIEDELARAKEILDKVPRSQQEDKKAGQALDIVTLEWAKLVKETYTRLAKITVEETRTAAKTSWLQWKKIHQDLWDVETHRYETATADPSEDIGQKKAIIQGRINQHAQVIRDRVASLNTVIQNHADEQNVSRGVYVDLSGRVEAIKAMVRPQLVELHDKLIEVDVTTHAVVNAALRGLLDELDPLVDTLRTSLHNITFEQSTFEPRVSSTPNHTLGDAGAASLSVDRSSHFSRPRYDYGKYSLPPFNGDPINYPAWKQEMKDGVLKGLTDVHAMRIMTDLSPEVGLTEMFRNVSDAWVYMDDLYANPVVVSDKVMGAFIATRRVDGANDQAKLVNLQLMLRKLLLTLEVVKQEHQLTNTMPMVNMAIKLLPERYREEFAIKIGEAESELPPDESLGAQQKFKLLTDWIDKKCKMLTVYCQDQLKAKRDESPAPDPPFSPAGEHGPGGQGGKKESKQQRRIRIEAEKMFNAFKAAGGITPPTTGAGGGQVQGRKMGTSRDGDMTSRIPASTMPTIKDHWERLGPCPVCEEEGHVFENDQGWHASSALSDCPEFMNDWDVNQRAAYVIEQEFCTNCLSRVHDTKSCKKDSNSWFCRIKENGVTCKGKHSMFLHGTIHKLS